MDPCSSERFENGMETALAHLDCISELPISINHYIYSFLPLKSIIATSVLSKSWHKIFTEFNLLVFDYIYDSYLKNRPECHPESDMCNDFMNVIEKDVCHRLRQVQESGTCLHTFNMAANFPNCRMFAVRLAVWLRLAIEMGVSEVFLKVLDNRYEFRPSLAFVVPEWLLVASCLATLELSYCNLMCTSSTKLLHLRKLVLTEVYITDDYVLQNLSTCCPMIEEFTLNACVGIDKLTLGSCVPQLRHLELNTCFGLQALHVGAPKLHTLIFELPIRTRLQCEMNLLCTSTSLKVLKLYGAELIPKSFEIFLTKHPSIEYLGLNNCRFLSSFIMSSQNLKSLMLRSCPELKVVNIDFPNLVSVDHDNPSTLFNVINIKNLRNLHIQLKYASQDTHWWTKLEGFLKETCFFDDLKFVLKSRNESQLGLEAFDPVEYFCDQRDVLIHDKMSAVSFCGKPYLNKANPFVCISSLSYKYILDDLLEECYPRTLTLVCPCGTAESVLENIMDHPRNWTRRSRKGYFRSERTWIGHFRDFEVDASDEAKKLMCSAFKNFLRKHSAPEYKRTTLGLKWFKAKPSY